MKQYRLVLIFILLYSSNNFAQNSKDINSPKIKVSVILRNQDSPEIGNKIIESFKKSLQQKGLFAENDEVFDTEMLINYKTLFGTKKSSIVVSVTVMDVIPQEIVKLGAENEVFYKITNSKTPDNISDKGKEVRHYMSSEYMQQFRMLADNSIDVIKR
ncbi:MAG: hypothetical protein GY936_01675 [Ignavibacteriae bacterium]|nr:hypothetical protein [Ignavibacteriota bacterium]